VEQHFRSYFLAAKKLEESPSPFQDGSTSQTPLIETPAVDAAAAGTFQSISVDDAIFSS
jgi:hypothetical protein